jgi:hypothetical protein
MPAGAVLGGEHTGSLLQVLRVSLRSDPLYAYHFVTTAILCPGLTAHRTYGQTYGTSDLLRCRAYYHGHAE